MVWYDFVVVALLVYTAWWGAQRGLVNQLTWIVALILCFKFADGLAPSITPSITVDLPKEQKHWIAMFVLFIGFSLASFMVARVITGWMEKAKFKDFDNYLGALFGLLKGVVIVLLGTFFLITVFESFKPIVLESRTGYAACLILDKMEPLTPSYFHEYLVRYREELAPIHDEHLGNPTTFPAHLSDNDSESPLNSDGLGQGSELSDFYDGLDGTSKTGVSGSAGFADPANTPTFDEMWRKLTPQLQNEVESQIRQRWNSATADQKQHLVSSLNRAFDTQLPSVVYDFLGRSNPPNIPQGDTRSEVRFQDRLNEIGRIYEDDYNDRNSILRQTMDHLAGVPRHVQYAVIDDWYADLHMQVADPDRTTTDRTRLDERILKQLDKAGIWRQLSLDLKQRLNQSRQ